MSLTPHYDDDDSEDEDEADRDESNYQADT